MTRQRSKNAMIQAEVTAGTKAQRHEKTGYVAEMTLVWWIWNTKCGARKDSRMKLAGGSQTMFIHQALVEEAEIIWAKLNKKTFDSEKQELRKSLKRPCKKLPGWSLRSDPHSNPYQMILQWSHHVCHDQKLENLEATAAAAGSSATNPQLQLRSVSKLGISILALNTHETKEQILGNLLPRPLKNIIHLKTKCVHNRMIRSKPLHHFWLLKMLLGPRASVGTFQSLALIKACYKNWNGFKSSKLSLAHHDNESGIFF